MVHWLDTVNWMLDLPMPAAATAALKRLVWVIANMVMKPP
jgi:predicted dehydrogenase